MLWEAQQIHLQERLRVLLDPDFLILERFTVTLGGEREGVGLRRDAVHYAGNDIGASGPVSVLQVG